MSGAQDGHGTPDSDVLPIADKTTVRAFLTGMMHRHPGRFTRILLLNMTGAAAGLVAPGMIGRLVGQVQHGSRPGMVYSAALIIIIALVVQATAVTIGITMSTKLCEQVVAELREDFLGKAIRLPLPVIEKAGIGDISTRVNNDIYALSRSIRFAAPEVFVAILTCGLALGVIAFISPWLLLPSLTVGPPVWLFTRWYLRRATAGYQLEERTYAETVGILNEIVVGASTLKALGTERLQRERLDLSLAYAYRAKRYTLWLRTIWDPVLELDYVIAVVSSILVGSVMYTHGIVSLGQLTATILYLSQAVTPLNQILSWLDELQLGSVALARLIGLSQSSGHDPVDTHSATRPDGTVTAQDVRFTYGQVNEAVSNVSLSLVPGETLVIVGPSGAGKSTLARLLAGTYRPTKGSVTVGATALSDLPVTEARRHVVMVTQESHVFAGSLRDNLALAKSTADDHTFRQALRGVGADEWVDRLPNGLDCVIGDQAMTLTTTQVQQLALARVLVADPKVLVLDEATSMMTPDTARRLERSLLAVLKERTVVVVAHRLEAAVGAHRVAVMDSGRLTQVGTHQELLRQPGTYADLWRAWSDQSKQMEVHDPGVRN
jgi:ABC-type multidrug transport system fused ATPase/permease subunit